jgi:hypothetical protein
MTLPVLAEILSQEDGFNRQMAPKPRPPGGINAAEKELDRQMAPAPRPPGGINAA